LFSYNLFLTGREGSTDALGNGASKLFAAQEGAEEDSRNVSINDATSEEFSGPSDSVFMQVNMPTTNRVQEGFPHPNQGRPPQQSPVTRVRNPYITPERNVQQQQLPNDPNPDSVSRTEREVSTNASRHGASNLFAARKEVQEDSRNVSINDGACPTDNELMQVNMPMPDCVQESPSRPNQGHSPQQSPVTRVRNPYITPERNVLRQQPPNDSSPDSVLRAASALISFPLNAYAASAPTEEDNYCAHCNCQGIVRFADGAKCG
jgi:hypothetical protein